MIGLNIWSKCILSSKVDERSSAQLPFLAAGSPFQRKCRSIVILKKVEYGKQVHWPVRGQSWSEVASPVRAVHVQ